MKCWYLVVWGALVLGSCRDAGVPPPEAPQSLGLGLLPRPRFYVVFRYGVSARNELNTLRRTFTKDLVLDGQITTRLGLSAAELDSVEARLLGIDFFSYPDTFVVAHGDTVGHLEPPVTYNVRVWRDSTMKLVHWVDGILSPDPRGVRLREFVSWLEALVQSKPEYQALPPPRGGYI